MFLRARKAIDSIVRKCVVRTYLSALERFRVREYHAVFINYDLLLDRLLPINVPRSGLRFRTLSQRANVRTLFRSVKGNENVRLLSQAVSNAINGRLVFRFVVLLLMVTNAKRMSVLNEHGLIVTNKGRSISVRVLRVDLTILVNDRTNVGRPLPLTHLRVVVPIVRRSFHAQC